MSRAALERMREPTVFLKHLAAVKADDKKGMYRAHVTSKQFQWKLFFADFRNTLRNHSLPKKFVEYLVHKVKEARLSPSAAYVFAEWVVMHYAPNYLELDYE